MRAHLGCAHVYWHGPKAVEVGRGAAGVASKCVQSSELNSEMAISVYLILLSISSRVKQYQLRRTVSVPFVPGTSLVAHSSSPRLPCMPINSGVSKEKRAKRKLDMLPMAFMRVPCALYRVAIVP